MSNAINADAEHDEASRIASLDVLRGLAILAILFVNIDAMGGSFWAVLLDIRHFGWTPSDQLIWFTRDVVVQGTARAMLEMLFGTGMAILIDRIAQLGDEEATARRYIRRNLLLSSLGLAHVFLLLWPGDILHTYGVAAIVAFAFRRFEPSAQVLLGLSFAAAMFFNQANLYVAQAARPTTSAGYEVTASVAARADPIAPRRAAPPQVIAEDLGRTSDFSAWAATQWTVFRDIFGMPFAILGIRLQPLELLLIWEAAATMLLGAGLFRLGIIQGRRSRRFYVLMALACYAFGGAMRAGEAGHAMRFDGLVSAWSIVEETARLAMTLGHVAAVHLLLRSRWGARALKPFEAAGRTALTVYLLQTLACLWVLYPPFAFALYGRQSLAELMATALAVNAGLLLFANWWVRRFRLGPVEWAWRSLVDGRPLPMRRPRPSAILAGGEG